MPMYRKLVKMSKLYLQIVKDFFGLCFPRCKKLGKAPSRVCCDSSPVAATFKFLLTHISPSNET